MNLARRIGPDGSFVLTVINGEPGTLLRYGDELFAAVSCRVDGHRVESIRLIRNPDKLGSLQAEVELT